MMLFMGSALPTSSPSTDTKTICYGYSLNKNTLILQTILLNFVMKKGYLRIIKPFQHYIIWRLLSIGKFYQSASQQQLFVRPSCTYMLPYIHRHRQQTLIQIHYHYKMQITTLTKPGDMYCIRRHEADLRRSKKCVQPDTLGTEQERQNKPGVAVVGAL